MPARCPSYAATRFVTHWFGDLEAGSEAADETKQKYSEACAALFDVIHTEVLAAPHDVANARASGGSPFAAARQTVTTVGLMIQNQIIENILIGGPAMISRQLTRGDEILKVDGRDVAKDPDSLAGRLVGSDVPGTLVCLQVRKGSGEVRDVLLARISAGTTSAPSPTDI